MLINIGVQWLSGKVLDSRPRLSLVLVQPRRTCPCLTERLLMGRKGLNQTKQTYALKEGGAYLILWIHEYCTCNKKFFPIKIRKNITKQKQHFWL